MGHPNVNVLAGGLDGYIATLESENLDKSKLTTSQSTITNPCKWGNFEIKILIIKQYFEEVPCWEVDQIHRSQQNFS